MAHLETPETHTREIDKTQLPGVIGDLAEIDTWFKLEWTGRQTYDVTIAYIDRHLLNYIIDSN